MVRRVLRVPAASGPDLEELDSDADQGEHAASRRQQFQDADSSRSLVTHNLASGQTASADPITQIR